MSHQHRLPIFIAISGQQVLGRLLRSAISRVVHVVKRAEIGAERAASQLRLATALVRDRHMMISDTQHSLSRLIVEEEAISLLGHVSGGLRVPYQNEERGPINSHVQAP